MDKSYDKSSGKTLPTCLAALSLVAVGLSIMLTQHYYDVRSGMAGFHNFCNLGTKMNCDVVAASAYSEFVGGIPLSSFSAGWYLSLFIIALIARNRFWRREATRYALVMTSVGLFFSLAYFFIMAFKIKTYCLFCLGLDVSSLLAWMMVLWMKPERLQAQPPEPDKWKKMASLTIASIAVGIFGLSFLDSVSTPAGEIQDHIDAAMSSPVLPVDTQSPHLSIGPENAPVTIVEFSDFQCPYCRIAALIMKSLTNRYPTQVRVIFKPFPLDISCNRLLTQPLHLTACEAARTALCAQKQDKFIPVYEALFENQTDILPGTPAKMAKQAGADSDQLAACIKDPATSQELSKSIEEGIQLGIQGTPTFFVNGHKIENVFPAPFWNRLVDKILAGAH
jgi:protein-disulfide isomerase